MLRICIVRGLWGSLILGMSVSLAHAKDLRYLALGDSIGTGRYLLHYATLLLLRDVKAYPVHYAKALSQATGQDVDLENRAVNLATSSDLLKRVHQKKILELIRKADFITVEIGGNDMLIARKKYKRGNCGGSDCLDCLREMVDNLRENWKQVVHLLATEAPAHAKIRAMKVYHPYVARDQAADSCDTDGGKSDFEAFNTYLEESNVVLCTEAAIYGIPCADAHQAMNGPEGKWDAKIRGLLYFDHMHPNKKGAKLIAQEFVKLGF